MTTPFFALLPFFWGIGLNIMQLSPYLSLSVHGSDANGAGGEIYTLSNGTLMIVPPSGGSVTVVNFTELSLTKADLSSTKAALSNTTAQLELTKASLAIVNADLDNTTSQISTMTTLLDSALARLSTAESQLAFFMTTTTTTTTTTTVVSLVPPGLVLFGSASGTLTCEYIALSGGFWDINVIAPINSSVTGAAPAVGYSRMLQIVVSAGGRDSNFVVLNTTRIYSFATNTYSYGPDLPAKRYWTAGTFLSDDFTFLVCGGSDITATSLTSCVSLDMRTKTSWDTTHGSMSVARTSFQIVLYQSVPVALGGLNSVSLLSSCEQYNPSTKTWSSFPSMISARRDFAGAVVDGVIYVACGSGTNSAEKYTGGSWSTITYPGPREYNLGLAFGTKFVAIGGNSVDIYDPSGNSWGTLPSPIISGRGYIVAAVVS